MGGSQSAKIFGEILPLEIAKCFKKGAKFKIYQQCLEDQIPEIKKYMNNLILIFNYFLFLKTWLNIIKNPM